jgi:hypothetical protein
MKQEINMITQQLQSIPPETQQTSNEQSDDSIPLKKCDWRNLCNPNNPDQQQSEEVWLSLSSRTCSPSEINQEELSRFNPRSILESEPLNDSKLERESDIDDSSGSKNKRKFPVIFEERGGTERSLRIAETEDSDSDDYCSWKSRREDKLM